MVSPEQVPAAPVADDRNANERKAIEDYFDRRLMSGTRLIQQTRSGWLKENIEAVIKDYRDLGWDVTGDGPWEFKKRDRQ